MKMKRFLLAISIGLSACSSVMPDYQALRDEWVSRSFSEYESGAICCSTLSELSFSQFDDSYSKHYLGGDSDNIRIKTYYQGETGMIPAASLFFPILIFLDSNFNLVEKVIPDSMQEHSGILSDLSGGFFQIFQVPDSDEYLVIYTTPEMFSQTLDFAHSGVTPVGGYGFIGQSMQFNVPFIPTGEVSTKIVDSD